jgi:preprotein translocase subunit SecD
MESKLRTRLVVIVAVILLCIFGIISFPRNFQQLKQNVKDRIRLGLDLKGGTHLILQVQVDDAIKVTRDQALERLKDELKAKDIPYADIEPYGDAGTQILIKGIPQDKSQNIQALAAEQFSEWDLSRVPGDPTGRIVSLKVSAAAVIRNQALEQAMNTIRNRIDQLGIVEPEVAEYGQGNYELVVQLPGVDDPFRVQEIIQQTALLELKIVRDGPYPTKEAALSSHGGVLPADTELLPGRSESRGEESPGNVWYLVDRVAAVTGRDLRPGGASPSQDENGRPDVNFNLTRDGAARFERVTVQNV